MPTNDTRSLLLEGIDLVDRIVAGVDDDAWGNPTPCSDWTVSHVLGHLSGTMRKALAVLAGSASYGAQPADPHDDVAGVKGHERWRDASEAVRELAADADLERLIVTPRGTTSVGDALALPISDLAVHAWDMAVGSGQRLELPASLLTHVRALAASLPEESLRAPGVFGPEQPAPADATETELLVAWLGRRVPR